MTCVALNQPVLLCSRVDYQGIIYPYKSTAYLLQPEKRNIVESFLITLVNGLFTGIGVGDCRKDSLHSFGIP